jgi:hypothetical protein
MNSTSPHFTLLCKLKVWAIAVRVVVIIVGAVLVLYQHFLRESDIVARKAKGNTHITTHIEVILATLVRAL